MTPNSKGRWHFFFSRLWKSKCRIAKCLAPLNKISVKDLFTLSFIIHGRACWCGDVFSLWVINMCCCISDEPIDDPTGKIKTYSGPNVFQKSMVAIIVLFSVSCWVYSNPSCVVVFTCHVSSDDVSMAKMSIVYLVCWTILSFDMRSYSVFTATKSPWVRYDKIHVLSRLHRLLLFSSGFMRWRKMP